jgi:hypothetical protein
LADGIQKTAGRGGSPNQKNRISKLLPKKKAHLKSELLTLAYPMNYLWQFMVRTIRTKPKHNMRGTEQFNLQPVA